MGSLLVIQPAPPGADNYTKWRIKSASSQSGNFSTIATLSIEDSGLHYYDTAGSSSTWYKTMYVNQDESTEFETSDAFQPQTQKYTSVREVENFIGFGSTLSATSNPTVQQVVEVIHQMQDFIDRTTGHAWRTRYSGTTAGISQIAQYEYYDIDLEYEFQSGRPIYLKHRFIQTLSAASGDALEIWDGSTWYDWLANFTEGRGSDFWLDYQRGILFVKRRYGVVGPMKARLKYRYGETTPPMDIQRACKMLVAKELLFGDSRKVLVPEGSLTMNHRDKVEKWEEDIDRILTQNKEFQIPAIST